MNQINASLPVDAGRRPIDYGNLVGTVIAVTYDATISSATDVTLNAATTSFEILAITQPILVRFAATVSTSAFDAVVAANQSKVFYRDPSVTIVSVIQAAATGLVAIIER